MITPATIYFIGILDGLVNTLEVIAIAAGMTFVICGIVWGMQADLGKDTDILRKFCLGGMASCIVCMFFMTFTPSSKLAAAMYVVPAIANNENVQAIGSNGLEALRKLTEDWLRELNGEKKPQDKEGKI